MSILDSGDVDWETLCKLYPVFEKMDRETVRNAFRQARFLQVKAGSTIFIEDQPCNQFPFVLSGTIRVFKNSQNGREITLYTVSKGDVCTVTAGCVLGHHPYSANAIVQEDCTLVVISSIAFEMLLTKKNFRDFVFTLFSFRLQELMMLVDAVAFQRLDWRLAKLLLAKGNVITVTHQQLEDELGTVREMISRVLKNFSEAGWIRMKREAIEICDVSGLRNVLNEDK